MICLGGFELGNHGYAAARNSAAQMAQNSGLPFGPQSMFQAQAVSRVPRRLIWIVLALSLALNVSLILGALYACQQTDERPRGAQMIAQLADNPGLSDDQAQQLTAIRVSVIDRYTARERRGRDWGNVLAGVLRQPSFNGGALKLGLVERDAGRTDFFVSTMSRLYDFTTELNPDARRTSLTPIATDESFLRRLFGPETNSGGSQGLSD